LDQQKLPDGVFGRLLAPGHAKLDTTALYTRVANTTIRNVTNPLDWFAPLPVGTPRPGV
jgi:hypothetical protein